MNKKSIFLLALSFIGINAASVEEQMSRIRKVELGENEVRYVASEIANNMTVDEIMREVDIHKNDFRIISYLHDALIFHWHKMGQGLEEDYAVYKERREIFHKLAHVKQLASDVAVDLFYKRFTTKMEFFEFFIRSSDISFDEDALKESYKTEVQPVLCKYIFAKKNEEQVVEELKQASSELKQEVIFNMAANCDCIKGYAKDSWQGYAAKHNIEIKKN